MNSIVHECTFARLAGWVSCGCRECTQARGQMFLRPEFDLEPNRSLKHLPSEWCACTSRFNEGLRRIVPGISVTGLAVWRLNRTENYVIAVLKYSAEMYYSEINLPQLFSCCSASTFLLTPATAFWSESSFVMKYCHSFFFFIILIDFFIL